VAEAERFIERIIEAEREELSMLSEAMKACQDPDELGKLGQAIDLSVKRLAIFGVKVEVLTVEKE